MDEEYKKHSKRRSRHFLLNQSERHSYAGVDGEDDISDNEEATPRASSPQAQNARKSSDLEEGSDASDDLTAVDRFDSPPVYIDETTGKLDHQVFLLHSNIITGGIGFATLVLLAIPLPLLHVLGWETFRLPPTIGIFTAICCNIVVGVVFNAGFMQLIS